MGTGQSSNDAFVHQHQRLSADATISLIRDSLGKSFRMDFLCIEGPNIPRGTAASLAKTIQDDAMENLAVCEAMQMPRIIWHTQGGQG